MVNVCGLNEKIVRRQSNVDPSLDIEGNFILISDREFLDIIIEKIDIKIADSGKSKG